MRHASDRTLNPLHELGISSEDEYVYRLLVEHGPLPAERLAGVARLSPTVVQAAVARLRERRLLDASAHAEPAVMTARAPRTALGALLLEHEGRLNDARIALEELTALHRDRDRHTTEPVVEVVYGAERVAEWFTLVQRTARDEVWSFVKPPYVAVTHEENVAEELELLRRGVRTKVLLDREVLADPAVHDELVAALDRGQEIRVAPELPVKLLAADRSLALVPLAASEHGPVGCVVVRSGGLMESLLALFVRIWDASTWLRAEIDPDAESSAPLKKGGLDPTDRRILTLLLAGHTDRAVASQLGMGHRTVQRRIREMMDAAGARSRIELGWHARDRSWI